MRSSNNPVLKSLSEVRTTNYYGGYQQQAHDPYGQYGAPQQPLQAERPMTVDDVVTNTGITLGVIIALAAVNFGIATFVNVQLALFLTLIGAIGGLVTVLVGTFGKKYGSKAITLTYAAFEGLFVGGISVVLSGFIVGKQNAGLLIGEAIIGTLGVFLGMLYVYKTGAVKVTPRFNRIMTGIVLAALSFISDFDVAEQLIREGAPARYSWGVAMGLAVTLVWLYTEILRLLSYFQSR